MYISDLDNTLLRNDSSLSHFTKEIWNDIIKKNIVLTIATARDREKTFSLTRGLNLKYPLIIMDGAEIISPKGEILYEKLINRNTVQKIINVANKINYYPFLLGRNSKNEEKITFCNYINDLQRNLVFKYMKSKRIELKSKIAPLYKNMKIVFMGDNKNMNELEIALREMLDFSSLRTIIHTSKKKKATFLTILNIDATKSNGIKHLSKKLQIDKEITVFGDSENDIDMFEYADNGIVVSNGIDKLKNIATYISPYSNDEDAVAIFLKSKYEAK